jgi:heme exporter protein D
LCGYVCFAHAIILVVILIAVVLPVARSAAQRVLASAKARHEKEEIIQASKVVHGKQSRAN